MESPRESLEEAIRAITEQAEDKGKGEKTDQDKAFQAKKRHRRDGGHRILRAPHNLSFCFIGLAHPRINCVEDICPPRFRFSLAGSMGFPL
jgi:hypothetical protein